MKLSTPHKALSSAWTLKFKWNLITRKTYPWRSLEILKSLNLQFLLHLSSGLSIARRAKSISKLTSTVFLMTGKYLWSASLLAWPRTNHTTKSQSLISLTSTKRINPPNLEQGSTGTTVTVLQTWSLSTQGCQNKFQLQMNKKKEKKRRGSLIQLLIRWILKTTLSTSIRSSAN